MRRYHNKQLLKCPIAPYTEFTTALMVVLRSFVCDLTVLLQTQAHAAPQDSDYHQQRLQRCEDLITERLRRHLRWELKKAKIMRLNLGLGTRLAER
jgi:hypothetical protein